MSLPLWECGLKSIWARWTKSTALSLPLWECGLKLLNEESPEKVSCVTPLVGVWIEIVRTVISVHPMESLPLWECGLK